MPDKDIASEIIEKDGHGEIDVDHQTISATWGAGNITHGG